MNFRYCAAFVILIPTLLAAQSQKFEGLWLTEDKEGVISITTCENRKNDYCGYLVQFPETGSRKLNKKLCGAKLIGEMRREGSRLTGGWIYEPESGESYNLTISHTPSRKKIRLRAYGRKISHGKDFIWTKYSRKLDSSRKSYWASCSF